MTHHQQGFFDTPDPVEKPHAFEPLAERMRPKRLSEIAGQSHILGEDKPLSRMIRWDQLSSLLLYGPPGTGKTTIAMVIAQETKMQFEKLSAVSAGVKEIRELVDQAQSRLQYQNRGTVLFIDEIHRFNKVQQDALLPYVEKGIVILIGATTENPFFSVNKALLSRMQMLELEPLDSADIRQILDRAIAEDSHLSQLPLDVEEEALTYFVQISGGDARSALGALEAAVLSAPRKEGRITVSLAHAKEALQIMSATYDKDGDAHYNTISAFIKSVRGSDPQAALYYLARMLQAGEDPMFIARRLIILASEDIGLANPHALPFATSTLTAIQHIGLPEGRIPLAQCTIYLASSPKSNTAYLAIGEAMRFVQEHPQEDVPMHLKDAHYEGGRQKGYGKDYLYSHSSPEGIVAQTYLPERYKDAHFYTPKAVGEEVELAEYLEKVKNIINKNNLSND